MTLTKTYFYFWVTSLVLFGFGLVYYNTEDVIDINVHDTYYVIPCFLLSTSISALLFFLGIIYYAHFKFKIPLIKLLSQIHVFVTLISVWIYYIDSLARSKSSFPLFDKGYSFSDFIIWTIILSLIIQPLFFINSLYSIIKYIQKKGYSKS